MTLELSDGDRYAILLNALPEYASDALDKVQEEGSMTAKPVQFQDATGTARDLIDEIENV